MNSMYAARFLNDSSTDSGRKYKPLKQQRTIAPEKRRRDEDSVKASATVREAVTDAKNEISQEEAAKACPRLARPRTRQDGSD